MNPLKVFFTPEYLFRPSQILVRLKRSLAKPPGHTAPVRLPWGAVIQVHPDEVIGANIWYYGLFDLIVAEALARLADPGEASLDIGANIGQMTTLLSLLAGPRGRVDAFEPHPDIFAELKANLEPWAGRGRCSPVHLHPVALSNEDAQGHLTLPDQWDTNRGIARVASATATGAPPPHLAIRLMPLDAALPPDLRIGVCKIDVEGHERQAFEGAAALLREQRIRDIIFEDLEPFPSPVHRLLETHGYTVMALWTRPLHPVLCSLTAGAAIPTTRDGMNYLATLQPDRARQRFRPGGWKVFRIR